MIGFVTNYRFFEGSIGTGHYYEIDCGNLVNDYYYANGSEGEAVAFGTEVEVSLDSKTVMIVGYQFALAGPFEKLRNIVNYQGFIVDCLDSDIGVYNLDNEIFLLGSACLDLPVGINVTLFNLHLMRLNDTTWIYRLFGSSLKKSTHILVYCPAFSSYLEGRETVSYDNLTSTRSNLSSLIYATKWLKNNVKVDFPGFKSLDELGSVLFPAGQGDGAQFIGHCEKCSFTETFNDLSDSLKSRNLLNTQTVKENFLKLKEALQSENVYTNQTLNRSVWLRNEIVSGNITRKNSVLFTVTSGDKTITVFCNDSTFIPEDGSFVFIFNSLQVVELVPKLRIANSWSVKAYLWISPETKIWSTTGYFWPANEPEKVQNTMVLCRIVRKYLIQKQIGFTQYETTVIQVESERGPHCFYLNPTEKFYGIISDNENSNYNGILALRQLISDSFFKVSDDPLFLPSFAITPTLSCTLELKQDNYPLQVRLADLPFLVQVKGLQSFSLKLRFYSISTLNLKLTCLKCKSLIEAGMCLGHFEQFSPNLLVSAVFDAADLYGTSCTVLIDQFPQFESILGTAKNPCFKMKLISLLKGSGKLKLTADNFEFSQYFSSTESSPGQLFPPVSKLINCTFPIKAACSVLKPINLEISDPKLELMNILKLF